MHIPQVFEVLREAKLFLKMSKCEFVRKNLIYLGHIVGEGQLKIDPSKVKVVMQCPSPTNVTETRSFLGVVQYLRKFITNFSFMASPLLQGRIMDFSEEENNNMLLICLKKNQ